MRLKRVTIGLVVVSAMAICLSLVSGAPVQNQKETASEQMEAKTIILPAITK